MLVSKQDYTYDYTETVIGPGIAVIRLSRRKIAKKKSMLETPTKLNHVRLPPNNLLTPEQANKNKHPKVY